MKPLKATIAAAALLTCLTGNDYPAKSQELGCTVMVQEMVSKAYSEAGKSDNLWNAFRKLDEYILLKNGCDPIGTGYRVKTAEIRLNSYLN